MRYKTNIFLSFQQMFLQHLQKGFFVKRFLFSEAGGGSNSPSIRIPYFNKLISFVKIFTIIIYTTFIFF